MQEDIVSKDMIVGVINKSRVAILSHPTELIVL